MVELNNEILDLLNGTSGAKKDKSKAYSDMKLIDLAKKNEDTVSNYSNDKSSNISGDSKNKFSFIKKKGIANEDQELEINNTKPKVEENLFSSLNVSNSAPSKVNVEPNLINGSNKEVSNNSKFSFIKSKKSEGVPQNNPMINGNHINSKAVENKGILNILIS